MLVLDKVFWCNSSEWKAPEMRGTASTMAWEAFATYAHLRKAFTPAKHVAHLELLPGRCGGGSGAQDRFKLVSVLSCLNDF